MRAARSRAALPGRKYARAQRPSCDPRHQWRSRTAPTLTTTLESLGGFLLRLGAGLWRRLGRSLGARADFLDLFGEVRIREDNPLLVALVGIRCGRYQLGKAVEPAVVEFAQTLHRLLVVGALTQCGLIRPRDQEPMLVDAGLGLRAVDTFLGAGEAEFDDLDALYVAAHRVGLGHCFEETVEAAAGVLGRADIRIDVVERNRGRGRQCRAKSDRQEKCVTMHGRGNATGG